jgi:hypothetical protein
VPVQGQGHVGHWRVSTRGGCRDSCILSTLPVYAALHDSPLRTERGKTVYFEIRIAGIGGNGSGGGGGVGAGSSSSSSSSSSGGSRFFHHHHGSASKKKKEYKTLEEAEAGVAIGYLARPYPTWRLPGWQRGSLGVHGDDGRKYVNDTFGGVDFTEPFKLGETVGIGITFTPPAQPPTYEDVSHAGQSQQLMDIDVFFTREGERAGRWDGNAELDDRSEGGTIGLKGECDLFAAIGVFGGVDVEVFFNRSDWKYQPRT